MYYKITYDIDHDTLECTLIGHQKVTSDSIPDHIKELDFNVGVLGPIQEDANDLHRQIIWIDPNKFTLNEDLDDTSLFGHIKSEWIDMFKKVILDEFLKKIK